VDGVGQPAAHAEDGAEEIGARTEVGDLAQEFQRVAFFLQRVGGVGLAEHGEFSATTSHFWPWPFDSTSLPCTSTEAPVLARATLG
jgi:hypothetical protein